MTKRDLKIIAGTATVIGIIHGTLELCFAPSYLVDGATILDSDIAKWIRLITTSFAPIAYIVIDYFEHREKKYETVVSG